MLLFLFLNYWLILFNSYSYTEVSNPETAEIVIPTEIPTKEAKAKIETYPVTVETKIRKCSI